MEPSHEHNTSAPLRSTDWDGDGNAFGLEHALGTNPLASDRNNSRNLTPPMFNAQGDAVLSVGRNSAAEFGTTWILYRSTDLAAWTEIYRFDGSNQMFDSAQLSVMLSPDSFEIVDLNPPFPKAFYQCRATLLPP